MTKYPPEHLRRRAEECPPTAEEEGLANGIARLTAERWRWPARIANVEQDDLIAEALYAAWKAVLTYDRERGVSLSTWIVANCRGAMQEALRQADPLRRGERGRYRAEEERYFEECAAWQPGDPRPLPPHLPRAFVSLEAVMHDGDEGLDPILLSDFLSYEDEGLTTLPDRLDTERLLAAAFSVLNSNQREVVRQCVMGERTYDQEAAALNLSASRIKQIRDESLRKMRRAVEAMR